MYRPVLTTVTTASAVLAGAVLVPALADTPAGWSKAPHVSAFDFLIVLVLIPLGLAAIIALLVLLPGLARDRGYEPGQSWRGESKWFGGPSRGVEESDSVSAEQIESSSKETGGTSGRW